MIDTNRGKTCVSHRVMRDVGEFETLLRIGQCFCLYQNLTLRHPRHMRVSINRETIRVHVDDMRERLAKTLFRLKR